LRNDEQVQKAAQFLFEGIAPERHQELTKFWEHYSPKFSVFDNSGPEGLFVLQGGLYRNVWFNHRAMRAFWLGGFIAWEGYRAIADDFDKPSIDLERFNDMIDCFFKILKQEDPEAVPLPKYVPEPGSYLDANQYPQIRAAAELATFATSWAFLHEIQHLRHQQDGTSAANDALTEDHHAEEFSCDEFATKFLLDYIDNYADSQNSPKDKVRQKRETGIYFALFAMTLISHGHWGQSNSHPSMQARIDAVMQHMGSNGESPSDAIAHLAFAALWTKWPEAPGPFKLLGKAP
jgi:Zn-dependent peptidase ImmA (M78 family)